MILLFLPSLFPSYHPSFLACFLFHYHLREPLSEEMHDSFPFTLKTLVNLFFLISLYSF